MPTSAELNEELNDLDHARQMLSASNYPQAELFVRRYLRFGGTDPQAHSLLHKAIRGYGLPEDFQLSERRSAEPGASPRYLLIKAWGFGFWSDVHHVIGQLLIAELTGRIPIVHWGSNSLYGDGDGADAYSHFFKPVSDVRLEDLPADVTIYPPKWTHANLAEGEVSKWQGPHSRIAAPYLFARPETVVVSDFYVTVISLIPWIAPDSRYFGLGDDEIYRLLFAKYLAPNAAVQAQIDTFYNTHMEGRQWVAVHVRGSDKILESVRLLETNAQYFGFVDRIAELNPDIGIFLLTDSVGIHQSFQQRYGERLVTTSALRSSSDTGVHMQGHDGRRVGTEVLVDAVLAARCDYFVGNQESNVSLAIASMKAWPKGLLFLLGDFNFRAENTFLHKRTPQEMHLCRLCGATVQFSFSKLLPGQQEVNFHKCTGCGALQPDEHHGLRELVPGSVPCDSQTASRSLLNFFALPGLLRALDVHPTDAAINLEDETGLLTRLLRDAGYNFYAQSPTASNYCVGYAAPLQKKYRIVTLFDVAERFSNPKEDWKKVFECDPDWVIGGTPVYTNQQGDWPPVSKLAGQPCFFHSLESLATAARQSGRYAYHLGMYFLFSRAPLEPRTLDALNSWRQNMAASSMAAFQAWIRDPFKYAQADDMELRAYESLSKSGKKIAIDGVFFRFSTGIARVWKHLLNHWSTTALASSIVVIDRGRTAPRLAGLKYVEVPHYDFAAPKLAEDRILLQEICDREDVCLFISTYYTTPLNTPSSLLVLDMIPEVLGYDLSNSQWVSKKVAIEYAQSFVSISKSTERDLVRFYPQLQEAPKLVSYCGCEFRAMPSAAVQDFKTKFGIERPYFLLVGERSGPKNAELFFKAFALLGELREKFAIVCTLSNTGLEPEAAQHVGGAQVHMVVLNDQELQCAYSGAIALAYPSRYEGFGLPVLEAMACACPAITCNNSSLPEVGADAVLYVGQDDVSAMHKALLDVQQPDIRQQLVNRGLEQAKRFSWSRMSREIGLHLATTATKGMAS